MALAMRLRRMRSTRRSVDLRDDRVGRQVHDQVYGGVIGQVTDILEGALHREPQILGFNRQFRDACIVAGDLKQVVEERLEPIEFIDHQLRRTLKRRLEVLTVVVDQIGGHAHGRQGGYAAHG